MLKRFLPNQTNFFPLFQNLTDILVMAATEFQTMLQHLDHPKHYVDRIAAHEEAADEVAKQTYALMHKTFITPFDRHDINQLVSRLDDIIDLMNRCAQRFPYYQLKVVPPEIAALVDLSLASCVSVQKAIYRLHTLKKADEIFKICEEIDEHESQAHQLVLAGERSLFIEEQDFKQFYKFKQIYEQIKLVINRCQDVGNLIKGIILEYS